MTPALHTARPHHQRGRALVRAMVLAGSALLAACAQAPTAPAFSPDTAVSARAATAPKLAPSAQASGVRGGYMLSSGFQKENGNP